MSQSQNQKTFMLKDQEYKQEWFVFDATGKVLGRLAAEIAKVLRGKHKPNFTPYAECGDGVIVINADKVRVTGNKAAQKVYIKHTGHPGGLRETPYKTMLARKPEYIIEHAVKGMLPHSRLARHQMRRLRIFAGAEHDLGAQKPFKANI